jgi:hypothetical protein
MKIGRSAITGKFATVSKAKSSPRTHVVETIKPAKPTAPSKPKKS